MPCASGNGSEGMRMGAAFMIMSFGRIVKAADDSNIPRCTSL